MATSYVWEESTRRYRDAATGRFLPEAEVRRVVDQVIDQSSVRVVQLAEQLQAQTITLARWQRTMEAELKDVHAAVAMAAQGGRQEMSQSDFGYLGSRIKPQYEFLRQWSQDLKSGTAPIDGRLLARATLYTEAARGTFEDVRRREHQGFGGQQERRTLHAAEHCLDCVAAAGREWVPIGTLPRIGDSQCRTRCRCTFSYRAAEASEEAA